MGPKPVTFATPEPDMSNRELGGTGSPRNMRFGRPKRGVKDKLMTIGWFHFVRLSLCETTTGAVARRVQTYFDTKGVVTEHVQSKRWYRYRDGAESPDVNTLRRVEELAPGSAVFFRNGPWDLWQVMWQDRDHRWDPGAAEHLFSVQVEEINSNWLLRAVGLWISRSEVAKIGGADALLDGFYDAVHLALSRENLKRPLVELGLWDCLVAAICEREQENLRFDPVKLVEIEAAALGSGLTDPISAYIADPVGFLCQVAAMTMTEAERPG